MVSRSFSIWECQSSGVKPKLANPVTVHVDKGEIYPKLNRIIDILDCWSYQFWTWNFLMCISLIYSSANCTKKYVHCKVIFANLLVILFFKPQQQTLKIQLVYWFWQLSCNCLPGFTTVIYSYQSHSENGQFQAWKRPV